MRRLTVIILMLVGFGLQAQILPFSIDHSFQPFFDFSKDTVIYDSTDIIYNQAGAIKDIWEDSTNGKIYFVGGFNYSYNGKHYDGHVSLHNDGSLNENFTSSVGEPYMFLPINDSVFVSIGASFMSIRDFSGNYVKKSWRLNMHNTVSCNAMRQPYFFEDGSSLWSNKGACEVIMPPDTFPARNLVKVDPDGYWDSTFTIDASKGGINFMPYDSNRMLMYAMPRFTIQYGNHTVNGVWRTYLDGRLDTTFNAPISAAWAAGGIKPHVQKDGKVFIVGRFLLEGRNDYHCIVRLNPNGSLDTTFMNHAGPRDSTGQSGGVGSVAPTVDGGYLVAGLFDEYQGYKRNDIAKIDSNGKVDPQYFTGSGPDSSIYSHLGIQAYIYEILPSAFGGYYVVGSFTYWNGQPSQPIIRLHGLYVGLEENKQEVKTLKIFPNPASGKISFYGTANEKPEKVLLIDIQGKSIKAKVSNTGFNSYEIDISNLQNGMYFLKLLSDGEVSVGKFVKE